MDSPMLLWFKSSSRSLGHPMPIVLPIILILTGCTIFSGLCVAASSQKPAAEKTATHQRFAVHPNDINLSATQSQVFGVTDAKGKAVTVRWKISGAGCANSPSPCGTIDGSGTYQAPQSLRQPLVVMLEGIPDSDSEYPAFARIQLSPSTSPAAIRNSQITTSQTTASTTPGIAVSQNGISALSGNSQGISNPAAQIPATPVAPQPSVTVMYSNGQLTIDAFNETLATVLRVVARKIGATIDVPPGGGLDHIVEHAGPGPASDVLTQLLKGSHFNFVMIGSPQRPGDLQQVLLTMRGDNGTPYIPPATTVAAVAVDEPASNSSETVPTFSSGPGTMTGAERLAYLRANGFGRSPGAGAQPASPAPDNPPTPNVGQTIKDAAQQIRDVAPPDDQSEQPTAPQSP
jgi:hypothetical protein